MTFIVSHADLTPRPACTCKPPTLEVKRARALELAVINGKVHTLECAIVVERRQRLRIGTGGAR